MWLVFDLIWYRFYTYPDPTSSVLSLVGEMAADDANSTFDTISDITGTGIATPSDGGGSILTSLSTSYTQVRSLQVIIPLTLMLHYY